MIRFTLDNIRALCAKLGNPQEELFFLHVAGTNGKGSTSAFIASILRESGYRTGVYSSPAVFTEEEIIRVNGRPISKKDYREGLARMEELCEGTDTSLFEKQTALAFSYFRDRGCDLVVLETGMGGELDATNLVRNTLVAVFTPISKDHTEYLGNSLSDIASVKAGILKKGCVAVSAPQEEEVLRVFAERSEALGVPFCALSDGDLACKTVRKMGEQKFTLRPDLQGGDPDSQAGLHNLLCGLHNSHDTYCGLHNSPVLKDLAICLPGDHQIINAALAVMAVCALPRDRYRITEKAIRNGLHKTVMPGRFEPVLDKPPVILDGAHNVGGAKALADAIARYLPGREIIGVAGMLRDKDHKGVMEILSPCFSQIFTVSTKGERGYRAEDLAADASLYHPVVTSVGGLEEALELAVSCAGKKGAVVLFGTLSQLADAKKYLKDRYLTKS